MCVNKLVLSLTKSKLFYVHDPFSLGEKINKIHEFVKTKENVSGRYTFRLG